VNPDNTAPSSARPDRTSPSLDHHAPLEIPLAVAEDGVFEGIPIQAGEDAVEIQVVLLPSAEPEPPTSSHPSRVIQPHIPVNLLEKLLELIENLPETSQQLADVQERAARAEERYAFELERRQLLEERVAQLEKELEHDRPVEKRQKRGKSRFAGTSEAQTWIPIPPGADNPGIEPGQPGQE